MPSANKGKGKSRDVRRSGSRNTTPGSSFSANATATSAPPPPSYLENDPSKLLGPATIQYAEMLDRMGPGSIPDSKTLEILMEQLKALSHLAEIRGDACSAGIRELSQKRKDTAEEQDRFEQDTDGRLKMKHEADYDDEPNRMCKGEKFKKRKERDSREDRPLEHGTHEVARQDGVEVKLEGAAAVSPASKRSKNAWPERASSSQPPPSLVSPKGASADIVAPDSPSSDGSTESHQPEPTAAALQVQVFGPNPLKFDDPTIYHIREVTPDMTDKEKREIYGVTRFPSSDLRDMMPSTLPDSDFSNAKPTNQVSANTFLAYIEPFMRPLTEEDIAFLKEKGDRVTPLIMPKRGKRHYTDIWREEDGSLAVYQADGDHERLPPNQGRGSIDQLTDDVIETDKISIGPLVSRLFSLLRYEHRAPLEETSTNTQVNGEPAATNGALGGGDSTEIDQLSGESENKPLPPATSFPDASPSGFRVPAAKLDHAQLDERVKAELRHVGFFGPDDNPDYDAHYDDDIAQRLRLLQNELKKQMITNNARKTRLLEIARERMAYQEYTTIHDDLDSQVQQAYLKRTRTLGKSKKGAQAKHRPGGPGGGSHIVSASGISRPAIGDIARTLMDRRKRWRECIGPIFKESKTTVPTAREAIFDPETMVEYEKAELEGWDEEQE